MAAICVPVFAMLITILVLSASSTSSRRSPTAKAPTKARRRTLRPQQLVVARRRVGMQAALVVGDGRNAFNNAFEAMWASSGW